MVAAPNACGVETRNKTISRYATLRRQTHAIALYCVYAYTDPLGSTRGHEGTQDA